MILNGLLPTNIQQAGWMVWLKVTITALVISLSLSACSLNWWVGDGRGDWTLNLDKGYAISRINSNEILLVHKENPNDCGGSIVLPNYYIISYQLHEQYICLEGIHTQNISISKNELNDMVLSYYLVDTTNDKVIGPFESYNDFVEYSSSLTLEIVKDGWIKIKN